MVYYVYLIKTLDGYSRKTYVGYTNNLNKRLNKHNTNKGAKSTKGYKWILIYKKKFNKKIDAMKFEYKLKSNRTERKRIFCNRNLKIGPFVYRLGHVVFILERGVRFP